MNTATEIPKFRAQLSMKRRSTITWILQFHKYADRGAALNAAMAVGRLVGFIEHFDVQLRNQNVPLPNDMQQMLNEAMDVWTAILQGIPANIPSAWLSIEPI